MHQHLGDRRIDLRELRARAGTGTSERAPHLVAPALPALAGFLHAARSTGWIVHETDTIVRRQNIAAIVRLATELAETADVVLVSGDPEVQAALHAQHVPFELFDDLSTVPTHIDDHA
jgi:hypothetical protein